MKEISRFCEVGKKLRKLKEITFFHSLRYFDWQKTQKFDDRWFAAIKCERSPLMRLLIEENSKNNVLEDAERICAGEMKVFNLDTHLFKENLSWRTDYYTGFEWPLKPFNRIYDPNDSGVDMNVAFEVSRLQFVPTLIEAHLMTGEPKYLNRLCVALDSWIFGNPYGFGVNWWSCMEVGLRAVNMALSVIFLSGHIPEKKMAHYGKILWKHALYIHKYEILREPKVNKNNHHLGAMLGLLVSSLCFIGKEAEALRNIAIINLAKEIPRQFLPDGANFESATGYHQFSLEVVLVAILILRTHEKGEDLDDFVGRVLGEENYRRLCRGVDLVGDYMTCYGQSPHIGDSSDCRVLVYRDYFSRDPADHLFLINLPKHAFGYERVGSQMALLRVHPYSGYVLLKNDLYGLVGFAGPKGTEGRGGHGHNDKCGFVLQVRGRPVFVDSGTYIYNSDTQARFDMKRGRAHNIVMIDGKEQCEINPAVVFGMAGDMRTEVGLIDDGSEGRFQMGHNGYRRFNGLGWIFRDIDCNAHGILLEERLEGFGQHEVSMHFNLHPDVRIERFDNPVVLSTGTDRITITFSALFQIHFEDSYYSASYHSRTRNRRIEAVAKMALPNSWRTAIKIS